VPSAREVAEAALFHIKNTTDPIVSFGQGCEGEPLLQAKLIEESIKIVRGATKKGTININTNGSKPRSLARLLDAGCEAVRISINSARDSYYTRYYRPKGYVFRDVIKSISLAKRLGALVSINYLTMPGFTDHTDEVAAIESLISKFRIDMIQWRNLNYDPMLYLRILKAPTPEISDLVGIRQEIALLKRKFPRLMTGYFNPRAAAFRRR
jgi:MoaA/NifB/PqqE/SkfB family radical SAM enzyme